MEEEGREEGEKMSFGTCGGRAQSMDSSAGTKGERDIVRRKNTLKTARYIFTLVFICMPPPESCVYFGGNK